MAEIAIFTKPPQLTPWHRDVSNTVGIGKFTEDIQDGPKKRGHRLMTIILSNLNRFKNLKNHWKILRKFAHCARGQHTTERKKSAPDNHVLACNFAKYLPILFFFTRRLSNKPFLIWLLTTPPHLKYADTLPCNLSLRLCFADNNVSQGSVATYARCGGFLISI